MKRAVAVLLFALVACQNKKSEPAPKPTETDEAKIENDNSVDVPATDAGANPHKVANVTPPFDVKTPPADGQKTGSGIVYKTVKEGTGRTPGPNDGVKIHYTSWRADGTTFASTEPTNEPQTEMLYSEASGLPEMMMLMKEGGKAMFWVPPELAAPPGETPEVVAFTFELLEVIPAPATPDNVAKPPANAKKTKAGISWTMVKSNPKGDQPRAWDRISLSYTGWSTDGGVVDSSEMKGKPLELPVERLPPVFLELVPQMHAGERARLWFPASMLGQAQNPDVPLCFEVEVHGVTKLVKPPDAPPDVAAPPADALKTPKGVSYVIVESGTGGVHPGPNDKVKVDYTGWTTDGHRFDSSIPEGKPSEFDINILIAGWAEVLTMMQAGDHWKVWIPEELAYKGAPQRQQGMLMFDLKLVEILGSKIEFTPPP